MKNKSTNSFNKTENSVLLALFSGAWLVVMFLTGLFRRPEILGGLIPLAGIIGFLLWRRYDYTANAPSSPEEEVQAMMAPWNRNMQRLAEENQQTASAIPAAAIVGAGAAAGFAAAAASAIPATPSASEVIPEAEEEFIPLANDIDVDKWNEAAAGSYDDDDSYYDNCQQEYYSDYDDYNPSNDVPDESSSSDSSFDIGDIM